MEGIEYDVKGSLDIIFYYKIIVLYIYIYIYLLIYLYLKCIPRGAMKTSEQGSELFSAVL